MSRISKFAARDPGPAARVAGFMAHLRDHGFRLGVGETETALAALGSVQAADPDQSRHALKAVCASCIEDAVAFDALFDSYWCNNGRVRQKIIPTLTRPAQKHTRSSRALDDDRSAGGAGAPNSPDGGTGEAEAGGEGRLVASSVTNLMKKDLRELVSPEDIAEAEAVARKLAAAMRSRRSRRRRQARKGDQIHFRKVIRQSLSTGGEPLRLAMKRRPERPVKLVALCDVSGSMTIYARIFLAFLAGLMRADPTSDAYLFHTRLVRITEALRDPDALRALNRLTLLADGFGGGSKIGASLDQFAQSYARRFVDGRSVVLILSDGYDTDTPELIAAALARLRKRGCKIIWLNPLKGWKDYAPVAKGMGAAMPYLDLFAAAGTLNDLAALEHEVARL